MSELTATDLRLERKVQATPEEAFDAWTNPEVLRRWWANEPNWITPVAEVDLRVGGRYRLSMEDPATGATHTVGGEYREVKRPERLVYTWCWERSDGQPEHTSTVTVQFLGEGERTTIVLEHTDLPSAESRDAHREGWTKCLTSLQARGISAGALEPQQSQ